jgi:tRNA threonylcarbamoyladenosine biosynthesis protein TsaB
VGEALGTLLGIDTSTAASAVCVERADGRRFEAQQDPRALLGRPAHAAELMPRIHEQLSAAGIGFGDLDGVAVGVGPGAYTGLRIGVATARALAHAHGLALRGVGSLAALAGGMEAPVALALIEARRGELFASLQVDGEERWPAFVSGIDALLERLDAARRSGLDRPLAAGDGSLRFRDALESASVEVAPPESARHVVRASQVCRLAARAPAVAPENVQPVYLRAPDATPPR